MAMNLKKMDEKLVTVALAKLELPSSGAKKAKAERLAAYFAKKKKADLVECSECGGDSTLDFDVCPYCGETDAEEEDGGATTKAVKGQLKKAKKKRSAAPKPKPKPKPAAKKPAAKGRQSPAPAAQVAVARTAALTKPAPQNVRRTIADLDRRVKRVHELKRSIVSNYYQLGIVLRELYDSELWQLRTEEGDRPKYTNWKAFTHEELGISYVQTYKLMDVSDAFTEEQVVEIGSSKLNLVLKVPEEHRAKLLEEARGGASKRDMEARVAEIQGKSSSAPEPIPPRDRMTIGIVPGRKTHRLLKRPQRKGDAPKPAKRLTDNPWVEVELGNDMRGTYRLSKSASGDLLLVVEYTRI